MNLLVRGALVACALLLLARPGLATENMAGHHIVIQVSQSDPDSMNLALNNMQNAIKYYSGKGEKIAVEIVAYGPGLNMLREDTSPVKDRIKEMKASNIGPEIHFSACHNTQMAMEKKEGHPIPIIPVAVVVPAGIVRLTQLQEQGWSYVRP